MYDGYTGDFFRELAHSGELARPTGLGFTNVDGQGYLYVASYDATHDAKILRYRRNQNYALDDTWEASTSGHQVQVSGLAFDTAGYLYVCGDSATDDVLRYDVETGNYVGSVTMIDCFNPHVA